MARAKTNYKTMQDWVMIRILKSFQLILFASIIVSSFFLSNGIANTQIADSVANEMNEQKHESCEWKEVYQDEMQTILNSPDCVIFVETIKISKNRLNPIKSLRLIAEEIYDGERPASVGEFKELAPGLYSGNFLVPLRSYVEPREDKMRLIIYGDETVFFKFVGITHTKDFDYLVQNLDSRARETYEKYLKQKSQLAEKGKNHQESGISVDENTNMRSDFDELER